MDYVFTGLATQNYTPPKSLVAWGECQLASNCLETAFRRSDPNDPHWVAAGLLLAKIYSEDLNIFEPTLWIYDLLLSKVRDPDIKATILKRCKALGVGSMGYEPSENPKD